MIRAFTEMPLRATPTQRNGIEQERAELSRIKRDLLSPATKLVVLPLQFASIELIPKENTYGKATL